MALVHGSRRCGILTLPQPGPGAAADVVSQAQSDRAPRSHLPFKGWPGKEPQTTSSGEIYLMHSTQRPWLNSPSVCSRI